MKLRLELKSILSHQRHHLQEEADRGLVLRTCQKTSSFSATEMLPMGIFNGGQYYYKPPPTHLQTIT